MLFQVATGVAFITSLFAIMKFQNLDDAHTEAIKRASNASSQSEDLILKTQSVSGLVFAAAAVGFEGAIGFIALVGRITGRKYTRTKRRIFTCLVSNMD